MDKYGTKPFFKFFSGLLQRSSEFEEKLPYIQINGQTDMEISKQRTLGIVSLMAHPELNPWLKSL